jgi:hypothetical protein
MEQKKILKLRLGGLEPVQIGGKTFHLTEDNGVPTSIRPLTPPEGLVRGGTKEVTLQEPEAIKSQVIEPKESIVTNPLKNSNFPDHPELFFEGFIHLLVTGAGLTGKTYSFCLHILPKITADIIIVCAPTVFSQKIYTTYLPNYCNATGKKCVLVESIDSPTLRNYVFTENNEIRRDPINPDKFYLLIFDDISPSNKKAMDFIDKMFAKGRHINFSTVYIHQSFFDIPKPIRKNANLFAFFKGMTNREDRQLAMQFATYDVPYKELYKMISNLKKYQFILVNPTGESACQLLLMGRGFEDEIGVHDKFVVDSNIKIY